MGRAFFAAVIAGGLALSSICFGYSGGSGTPEAPYQIANKDDLLALAGTTVDYNKCFILTADINMTGQVFTTAIIAPDVDNSNHSFDGNAFTGTFDGNSHKITTFTINGGSNDYLGLFGCISGSVKNLGLENCAVNSSSESSECAGSLVGLNGGSISNCYSTGNVTGGDYDIGGLCGANVKGSIVNCYSTSDVSGYTSVGGLCGRNEEGAINGSITDCYSTGEVTGGGYSTGGLCGYNGGDVTNCYSTSLVIGNYNVSGLCGFNRGNVTSCYSTGNVTGNSYTGGLCGVNDGSVTSNSITNCYSTGNVTGNSYTGGLCGVNSHGSITDCNSTGAVSGYDECTGGLCGKNYYGSITGCHSTGTVSGDGEYNGGLCGMNESGSITNCYANGTVSGYDDAGGLVGHNYYGSINDCHSTGVVNCSTEYGNTGGLVGCNYCGNISNCYSTGAVSGSSYVGGLVGYNYSDSIINNCYSTSIVSSSPEFTSACIGGLVGDNDGSIDNCYSTGTVSGSSESFGIGGLVGNNDGGINDCYSTGTVSGTRHVGGLVGWDYGGSISNCYSTGSASGSSNVGGLVGWNSYGSISNCYSTGSVSGSSDVGGLMGYNENGSINGCYFLDTSGPDNGFGEPLTDEWMKQQSSFVGWDFVGETINGPNDIWKICEGESYPQLWYEKYGGGLGDANNPYLIYTSCQMNAIVADTNDWDKHFKLMADIDMEGQVFATAIIAADTSSSGGFQGTVFTGTFDGNGHKITNFTINGGSNYYLGLFGYIGDGGSVKNLCLENFAVSGYAYLGGLAGWNNGSISNCYSTGAVSGGPCVGGLVGLNQGSISNCYSTGAVSGSSYVGGLVGWNNGSISDCYSTGTVSGSDNVGGLAGKNYGSISNCYSTGAVSGTSSVGGLVGYNGGTVNSCYFLVNSGPINGYGQPLMDAQMRQQSSFVGWDFVGETANGTEDIWRMCIDGVNYPLLWWQFNTADFTCPDGVDFIDFAILANAWLSDTTQVNWNGHCDIAEPPDSIIDILDLAIFTRHWLEGI